MMRLSRELAGIDLLKISGQIFIKIHLHEAPPKIAFRNSTLHQNLLKHFGGGFLGQETIKWPLMKPVFNANPPIIKAPIGTNHIQIPTLPVARLNEILSAKRSLPAKHIAVCTQSIFVVHAAFKERSCNKGSHSIHGTGYLYHNNQPNVGKYTIHGRQHISVINYINNRIHGTGKYIYIS